jgi:hypothetical protein
VNAGFPVLNHAFALFGRGRGIGTLGYRDTHPIDMAANRLPPNEHQIKRRRQRRQRSSHLIADARRRADAPVRRKLLERLLRPVGSLALAAIASGAFSAFLLRRVTLDDVARITAEQFVELARFVDQVNPDVLQQILSMLA